MGRRTRPCPELSYREQEVARASLSTFLKFPSQQDGTFVLALFQCVVNDIVVRASDQLLCDLSLFLHRYVYHSTTSQSNMTLSTTTV